jgi:hypothetical protein
MAISPVCDIAIHPSTPALSASVISDSKQGRKAQAFRRFTFLRLGNFHWLGSVPSINPFRELTRRYPREEKG